MKGSSVLTNKAKIFTILFIVSMALLGCGSDSEGPDSDNDSIPDARDNCIQTPNANQLNTDGDAAGDACDDLPQDASDTKDFDGDKIGDTADPDDDSDTYNDDVDAFPYDAAEWLDADVDGLGDNKDLDPNNASIGSIQLGQLINNGRVTKFIGAHSIDGDQSANFGEVVTKIGDINGDGLDDLFIGASRTELNEFYTGRAYILFGQENGWPATVDLADLSNVPHIIIQGDLDSSFHAGVGASAVTLGDINEDGLDEFVLSAFGLQNETVEELYNGAVFLVFGQDNWLELAGEDNIITLAELNNLSVKFRGKRQLGYLGWHMENLGDVNGDGQSDISISEGTTSSPGDYFGRVHIMFNLTQYSQDNMGEVYDIDDITNTESVLNRAVLNGESRYFGEGLKAIQDFNADGYDDFITRDGANPSIEKLYIVFGKATENWSDESIISGVPEKERILIQSSGSPRVYWFGADFAGADINNDQLPDLIVSSTYVYTEDNIDYKSSFLHVLHGGNKQWPTSINEADIPQELGYSIQSEVGRSSAGAQIAVFPDLNGNGYPEILLETDDAITEEGNPTGSPHQIYKFDTSLLGPGATFGPSQMPQGDMEIISLIDSDPTYQSVFMNVLGDLNGDGLSEMSFSAAHKDSNGLKNNGEFYLLYGYDELYPQAFKAGD